VTLRVGIRELRPDEEHGPCTVVVNYPALNIERCGSPGEFIIDGEHDLGPICRAHATVPPGELVVSSRP
jgi:hypothetical protein